MFLTFCDTLKNGRISTPRAFVLLCQQGGIWQHSFETGVEAFVALLVADVKTLRRIKFFLGGDGKNLLLERQNRPISNSRTSYS
jgi:hypothetical protein